ncbi:hypothetical protein PLESTF_000193400 [Pleodorina starrii]|nr:hypothetical protein PLESTF_000193400 [Pleodorina starrii]
MALVTLSRGAGYVAGCPQGTAATAATTPGEDYQLLAVGAGADGSGAACPACDPRFAADTAALETFPCDRNPAWQYIHTLRHLPGFMLHAAARRDDSVWGYMAALAGALGVMLVRPSWYVRWRNGLVLAVRCAMMAGNVTAAAAASPLCMAATTALYYMPSYMRTSGTWVNIGLFFMAVKAVTFGRVPLSYHLPFGLLEWCLAVLTAYTATLRTLGPAAASRLLTPSWLLLHLAAYFAGPCWVVWRLEEAQRGRFRALIAASPRSSFSAARPPSSAIVTPYGTPSASPRTSDVAAGAPLAPAQTAAATASRGASSAAAAVSQSVSQSASASTPAPEPQNCRSEGEAPSSPPGPPPSFVANSPPSSAGPPDGDSHPSPSPPPPPPLASPPLTPAPSDAGTHASAGGAGGPAVPYGSSDRGGAAVAVGRAAVPSLHGAAADAAAGASPSMSPSTAFAPSTVLPLRGTLFARPLHPPQAPSIAAARIAAATARPASPSTSAQLASGAAGVSVPAPPAAAAAASTSSAAVAVNKAVAPTPSRVLSYKALTTTRFVSYKLRDHAGLTFPSAAAAVANAFLGAMHTATAPAPPTPAPAQPAPSAWPTAASAAAASGGPPASVAPATAPFSAGCADAARGATDSAAAQGGGAAAGAGDSTAQAGGGAATGGLSYPIRHVALSPSSPSTAPPAVPYMSLVRSVVVEGCVHLLSVVTAIGTAATTDPWVSGGAGAGAGGTGTDATCGAALCGSALCHMEADGLEDLAALSARIHAWAQRQYDTVRSALYGAEEAGCAAPAGDECGGGGEDADGMGAAQSQTQRLATISECSEGADKETATAAAAAAGRDGGGGGAAAAAWLSPVAVAVAAAAATADPSAGAVEEIQIMLAEDDSVRQRRRQQQQQEGACGQDGSTARGCVIVRAVAVGTCGGIVLDELLELSYDLYGSGGSGDGGCAGVRLRLPKPSRPGVIYIHLLPAPSPPPPEPQHQPSSPSATAAPCRRESAEPAAAAAATASSSAGGGGGGGSSRPLTTLPLLVLPSTAAAAELCWLYDTMTSELQRAWMLATPAPPPTAAATAAATDDDDDGSTASGGFSGSAAAAAAAARAVAFARHFLPLAHDLGHLLTVCRADPGCTEDTGAAATAAQYEHEYEGMRTLHGTGWRPGDAGGWSHGGSDGDGGGGGEFGSSGGSGSGSGGVDPRGPLASLAASVLSFLSECGLEAAAGEVRRWVVQRAAQTAPPPAAPGRASQQSPPCPVRQYGKADADDDGAGGARVLVSRGKRPAAAPPLYGPYGMELLEVWLLLAAAALWLWINGLATVVSAMVAGAVALLALRLAASVRLEAVWRGHDDPRVGGKSGD